MSEEESEQYRDQKFQGKLEEYKATWETNLEAFRATIQVGQAAIKSAILINGGASVAILAFIGNLFINEKFKSLIPILSCSLAYYVFGTLIAAVAYGGASITVFTNYNASIQNKENSETKECYKKWGNRFNFITAFLVIASYVLFGLGTLLTYKTFLNVE